MGWSEVVREVSMDDLIGRPRGDGGRFWRPWSGWVGFFMCGVSYLPWRVCIYLYLCSFVGACTSVPLVSFVCFVSTNGGLFFTVVRIQSKIVFEFKNLTAICLNAAHWI